MWVPPQWRTAFPAVTAVIVVLAVALAWGASAGNDWVIALAGGVIVGLIVSIAWTIVPLVLMFAVLFLAAALTILILIAVMSPVAAAGVVIVTLAMMVLWYFGYTLPVENHHAEEMPGPLRSLGGEGTAGRALIVHHPGASGLHTGLQEALAEGLKTRGWQVDIVPASLLAPGDLSPYGLVVLGGPSYNFRPAAPLRHYIARVHDLAGKPVLLVVSGGGLTEPAARALHAQAAAAHAHVLKTVEVWRTRDNCERYGIADPLAVMRHVGETLEVT